MATHKCSVCGLDKPRGEFRWNPKFGVRGECKECEKTVLRCAKCGEVKPHDGFPPCKRMSTGRHGWCFDCHGKRMKDKYATNPEHRKKHKQHSRGEKARQWRREYNARPEVIAKARARDRERYERAKAQPDWEFKQKARYAAARAVRNGILVRPECCQANGPGCLGSPVTMHHHKGYAPEHALDVEWLCTNCHALAEVRQRMKDEA